MKRLFVILFIAAAALTGLYVWVQMPGQAPPEPVLVDFARGMPSQRFAEKLRDARLIPQPAAFHAARLFRWGKTLQAGEYRFAEAISPLAIVDKLIRGDVHYYEVTIPEGTNAFELQAILQSAKIAGADKILPRALAKEGMLFPAVYRYTKGMDASRILDQMEARFERAWTEAGGAGPDSRKREIVTLASLVETEARVADERPIVASVYRNRLDRGIKLDCDPTVIYASLLEGKYRGTIYRSDLDRDHPYNTYLRPGLPPGPIANPGLASLKAALQPAPTPYLFFVAKPDGSGRHVFSESIAAHNRAVEDYRRGESGNKKEPAAGTAGAQPRSR